MFKVIDENNMLVNIKTDTNSHFLFNLTLSLIMNISDFDNIFVANPTTGYPSRILSQGMKTQKTYIKCKYVLTPETLETINFRNETHWLGL